MAFRRELNFGLVTIVPGARSLGSVIYENVGPFDSSDYRAEGGFERISNVMFTLLAGPAAERWCANGRILTGETWDEDTVAEVASKVCGGDKEKSGFLKYLRSMTDRWIELNSIQRGIRAVGDALLAHGSQGLGWGGIEYQIALEHAKDAIDNLPPGAQLRFVGHSLGGGLATAAAAVYNRPATTFNAAGVHEDTVHRRGKNLINIDQIVDAYRVQGEILSTLQDSNISMVGLLMPDGNGTPYWLPATASDPISRHFMTDVLAGFDKM
ncbi:MAG TPA: hypothetical protein VMP01_28190 [Pirellulaceae bacterium]|nr:hypothetical protein [Pirellulaceae bacterium]